MFSYYPNKYFVIYLDLIIEKTNSLIKKKPQKKKKLMIKKIL